MRMFENHPLFHLKHKRWLTKFWIWQSFTGYHGLPTRPTSSGYRLSTVTSSPHLAGYQRLVKNQNFSGYHTYQPMAYELVNLWQIENSGWGHFEAIRWSFRSKFKDFQTWESYVPKWRSRGYKILAFVVTRGHHSPNWGQKSKLTNEGVRYIRLELSDSWFQKPYLLNI